MTPNGGNGWTSPAVILTIMSLVMVVIGGYLSLQRDESDYLRDIDQRLTRVETMVEYLRRPQ